LADADYRQRHGLPEDRLIVTFAGEYTRLGSTKLMMKILPELAEKSPHCHMIIACRIMGRNDISEERKLKQFVESHHLTKQVHFAGQSADFPSLLKASDMLVFAASEMNGKIDAPLTLLEAMANGLPIVSCDIPPLNEVFDGEKEFLVDKDNVPGLIFTILSLVNNPQKRIEQGCRNQQRMLREYDINNMVNRYEALYETLH
jgi:glycosyltransferase involved in cell wall biosynthesis